MKTFLNWVLVFFLILSFNPAACFSAGPVGTEQGAETEKTEKKKKSGAKVQTDAARGAEKAGQKPGGKKGTAEKKKNGEEEGPKTIRKYFGNGSLNVEFTPTVEGSKAGVKKKYDYGTGVLRYEWTYDEKGNVVRKRRFDDKGNVVYDKDQGEVSAGQEKGRARTP